MGERIEIAHCKERKIDGREGAAGRGGAVFKRQSAFRSSHSLTLAADRLHTNFFLLLPSPLSVASISYLVFFFFFSLNFL